MSRYYPVMLDIRHRPALVIGGNKVAAEKAAFLQAAGAQVTAINTEFGTEMQALATEQKVTLRQKAYEYGDLKGAFIVVATANNNPALAETLWQESQEDGLLLNIVDLPQRCNFILPSILRRGKLTIAVSTEGAAPGLAKRIRQHLEDLFPSTYETYLQLGSVARRYLRADGVPYEKRDAFFGEFFSSNILALLNERNITEALASTTRLLKNYHIDITPQTLIHDLTEVETNNDSNSHR